MINDEPNVYSQIISDLWKRWNLLITAYTVGDTAAAYLRSFELNLSLCCPDKMLWNFDIYKDLQRIQPFPKKVGTIRLEQESFFNYLLVYEQIMREIGLIDKKRTRELNEQCGMQFFSLNGGE